MNRFLQIFYSVSNPQKQKLLFRLTRIICFIALLLSAQSSFAHHLKGGWIYYEYLGNGTLPNTSRYKITVKQYLDCNSTAGQIDNVIYLGVFGGTKSDSLINDISIPLAGTDWENKVSYGCINPSTPVCYRVDRYITTIDLPNNNEGYVLSVQRCCRIDGIVNVNASDSAGLTYTNKLPGVINGVSYRNDNSPVFTQKDTAVVCQNNYFTFDFSATDADGDRLSYAFTYGLKGGDQTTAGTQPNPPTMPAPPYDSTVSISYASPFTYQSPMGPGVTIDPNTGIISGTAPNAIGDYVIAVAVSEYRNNVLIGVTRKELHINVANCTVLYAITSQVNTQCMSGPTGSATATGSGGVGPYSYSWNTTPVQNTATATNLAAGTYTVSITDANSCSTSKSVTIVPVPKDPAAANNGPLCVGGTLNLTSTTITGTDYKWTGPNGFTSTLQNPVITNVTSANAGVYSVSATINNCGGAASSTTVVINNIPSAPVVSSNGPLCVGSTLNLTASTIAGATYKWSGPNGFSSSLQNPSISNVTSLNAGTYSVYVTVNSCVSPLASTNVVINTIPPTPVASSNSPICSGTTLNLSAAMSSGYNFSWTGPNGFTSTLQNPSISNVSSLNAGVYTVSANLNGCVSTVSTTTVSVKNAPATPVISGTTPICAGSKITFTSSNIPASTYKWSGPNAFTSTVQNPVINAASVAAAGVYSLIVTANNNGCSSAPATVNIVVNPIPATPTVNNNGPLCVGTTLNLSTPSVTGATFNWSGPNAFTSTLQNPSITNIATINAGTYSLTETVNGCTSPSGSTSLIVNTIPAAPVVSNNGPICSGSVLTLNATAPGSATYIWSGPNSFTSGLASPSINNATSINAGTYSLSIVVNGCTSPSSTTNAVINFVPAPVASSNGPLCVGSNLSLNASLITGATYSWTGPNAFVSASQNPTINNVTLSNGGNYAVIASANGCTSAVTTLPVVINAIPAAPVNNNNGPICSGSTLNLFSNFYTSGSYSWTGPNGFTSTVQNPVITNATVSNSGAYSLKVSVNGCTSPSTITNAVVNAVTPSSVAGNSGPVCEGGTLSLSATTVTGATYSWTGPNGFTSSLQNPVINNISAAGAGTYSLQTIINSCPSQISTTTVTVKSLPSSPVPSSDAPVCEGSSLHLAASSIASATYLWNGPNSFSSALQSPVIDTVKLSAAGIYNVAAVVNGCTSATSSINITIKPKPAAATASSNQPVCQGGSLNLNASQITGVSYSWSGPSGFTSSVQNPVINNASSANAGAYIVTTYLNNCSTASAPVTVSITPLPSASVASSNSPVCEGTSLTLSASTIPGVTYTWNGPNGFTSSVQNPVITNATPANTGAYTLNTVANGCSSQPASVNATVNAIPVTPNVYNNGPLCPGATLNLSADFLSGASYHWTGPNGFTSTLQNPTISNVNAANSGTYSLYVVVNNCTSPVRSTTVSIMGTPSSPTMPDHGPVCEGSPINLTAAFVSGASYNWSGPNGFSSTLQNPTINNASTANSGTYSLVISVNGCGSQSTSTDIVVNPIPAAPVIYNNAPICSGTSLSLSSDPVVDATYNWSGPKSFISHIQNPVISNADTSNAGVYSLSISLNGCASPTTSANIVIKSLPAAVTVSNNGPLCQGSTLNLNAGFINGATYSWSGPSGFSSNSQNPAITNVSSANAGTYNLTTTVNGCSSLPVSSAVVINAVPSAPVVSNNGPLCEGSTLNLTANTVNGASYSWSGPNAFVSNGQNPVINNVSSSNAGSYSLIITTNNCSSVSSSTNVVVNPIPATPSVSNNGPLCIGSILNLSAGTIPGATYNWVGPNGFTSALQNPVINNISSPYGGTYSLITTVNNCASQSSSTKVVVNPIPSPAIASNNGPLCNGADLNLSASFINGATYSWSGPNGFTSSLQNPLINNISMAGAGSYNLITTVNGCASSTSSTVLTVNSIPAAPAVANNGPLCEGSTLKLSTGSVNTASYNWTGPNGFNSTLQNPVINNATSLNAGNYQLTVSVNGCISPASATNVTINPIPTVTSVNNNGPLCNGSSLQLSTATVAGALYSWNGPNGFISSIQNPVINNIGQANGGTYYVSVTSNGCTSSPSPTSVVVNPTPATPVINNNGPLCEGATLYLTTDAVSGATYNWSGPNGFTSTQQNPVINNATSVNAGTYSLTITVNGCASLAATTTVVVNSTPAAPSPTSNSPICAGTNLLLNTASVAGAVYNWTGPNGFTSSLQNPEIKNADTSFNGLFNLSISVNGCASAFSSTSVTINPVPNAASVHNNGPLCVGTTLKLSADSINGATYSWTGPAGFTSNEQNPSLNNIDTTHAGAYNLIVTINGCSSPFSSTSLIVNPLPQSSVSSNNGPLCAGSNLMLSASDVNNATYSWTGPNGFVSYLQNPVINNVDSSYAGIYKLITSVNGCSAPVTSTNVQINPIPDTAIINNNSPLCEGSVLNLTASTIPGAVYNWSGPNGFKSTQQNPVINNISVANQGIYNLFITVNGCNSQVASTNVVINPTPSSGLASNNGPLCEGTDLYLSSTSIQGASYHWTGPNGFVSSLHNLVISNVNANNSGTYTLITSVNGCNSLPTTTDVTINPLPVVPDIFNNGPLCEGSTLNLKTNTVGVDSYSWTGPNSFTSTVQNPSIPNIGMVNHGAYSLSVSVNGCSSLPASTTVDINTIPSVPAVSNNGPLCEGSALLLNADSVAGAVYNWTGPNGFTSGLQNPVINNSSSLNAGTYNLSISVNNCSSISTSTTVIINANPAPPAISNNGPLCEGASLNLTSELISGATYNWTGPNGFTSALQNPVINNISSVNAGTYSLTTTVNNCNSQSSSTNVVINTKPAAPSVANNGPLCEGSTLSLSAEPIAGATYNWTGPNGFTSNLQNPFINNATSVNSGVYNIIATVNNCVSQPSSTNVIINPIPAAPVISNNGPLCEGSTLNLTAELISGATYNWTGPGGFTSVAQSPVINNVSSINGGTYALTTTVNNCSSLSSTTDVVINPVPMAPSISGNAPLCSGSSLILSTPSIQGASFSWSGPNGFTSNLQNPTINNVSALNSGIYNLSVIINNCQSQSSQFNVVVNALLASPQVANNGPLCEGTDLKLSAALITGATYNWTGPNGFSSNLQDPTIINAKQPQAGSYSLTILVNGCSSQSASTDVVINPIPVAPTVSNNGPLCEGSSLNLYADSVTGASYNWSGPNGFTSTLKNPVVNNVTSINAGSYNLTTTVNNCVSQSSSTAVIINPLPPATTISNNGPLCEASTLKLFADQITGASYNWTGPNGFTSTQQNPVITNVTSVNAGTYNLITTVNNCASQTSSTNVVINPIPSQTTVSNNGPLCEGATLNLTADLIPGATYNWSGPNGFTSTLQNPVLYNVTSVNAGIYNLITTVNNCASQSSTSNVVINSNPSAPTVSNNGPLCEGTTLNLSADLVSGASYYWKGPNGFTSALQNPIIKNVTSLNAGIYNLLVTINNCTSQSSSTDVIINSIPSAPVISNNGPLCEGTTLNLSSENIAGATYSWSGPNGFTSSLANPFINKVSSINAGNYNLITTVNNCASQSSSTVVVVNSLPPTPTISSNGPLCEGSDLKLSTDQIAGVTYLWNGPNGFTSTLQNPGINKATAINVGSYSLIISANGCSSQPSSTNVIINQIPSSPAVSNNGPLCEGASLNLTASQIAGATYSWSGPNGFSSMQQNPVINNVSSLNAGTYNLIATVNNCASLASSTSVVVNSLPAATNIINNGPLCEGSDLKLTAETIAGATYHWSGPNGFTSDLQNPVINNAGSLNAGTYSLITTVNNCASQLSQTSVVINPIPSGAVVSNNGPVCAGSDLYLSAQSIAGATYTWAGPGSFSSSEQNPVIANASSASAGTYNLITTVAGCSSLPVSTFVTINQIPATPLILNNAPLCEGQSLILSTDQNDAALYNWNGPNGFSSNLKNPQIDNVKMINGGIYTLGISKNGCNSKLASSEIHINQKPQTPTIITNSPICVGSDLNLSSSSSTDVLYNWTGPNGFVSSINNPVIKNVTSANGGVYSLIISKEGCLSDMAQAKVIINAPPAAPSIASNGPVCVGSDLILTASNFEGKYYWTGPAGFNSTAQNPIIKNVSQANAGSYEFHYSSNNCSESVVALNVNVNAAPIAAITSNTPVCEYSELTLSASFIQSAKYVWTGPNGFFSTDQNPKIINVGKSANGTYSLTVTTNNCASNPVFTNVIIKNKPGVPAISANTPVCEGGNINLITTGIVDGNYNWSGPAAFTSNVLNPVINNVSLANAGMYNLYVMANGCSSDTVALNISVNAIPQTPAIFNNGPVCEGSDLQLTSSASTAGKFLWSGPAGFSSTIKDPVLKNAQAINAGVYKLMYSLNGCNANEVSTTVIVKSKIPNVVIAGNGPLCDSATLQLNATLIPGATYHWTGPNGFTSTLQNPSINFATSKNSGTYALTVMSDGCNLSGASTNVIVRNRISEPKIVNNSPLCVGATLNLITENIQGAAYSWSGPGTFKSTIQNPVISNVSQFNAGTYSLVVSLNGCSSKPGFTDVVVNPKLNLPPASNNGPLCEGATLKLISISAVGATYMWTGPNGFTSTDQNPVIPNVTQKYSGVYHLVLNVAGCNSPESSVNVSINAAPATPVITSNDPVCEGATLNMSINSVIGTTYNWTGPQGFNYSGNSITINNIDSSKSGTYKVVGTTNGCNSIPATHSIIINKTPAAVSLASNTPVCEGGTLNMNSNAPGNAEFLWSGPDNFISALPNPIIYNATPTNSGTYKLFIKLNGCIGKENDINISVKPAPQKPVASSVGKLCEGDSIKLNAAGSSDLIYKWSGPNYFVSNLQNPVIANAKINNNGVYKIFAVKDGCAGLPDSLSIAVNPIPGAPAAKSNAPLCDGTTLNFSVEQIQNTSYSWTGPNGFSSSLPNPVISTVNINSSGSYKVVASRNGCTSPETLLNVQVKELPLIAGLSNNGPLCNGNELVLSTNDVPGTQYKWTGPAGFSADIASPHLSAAGANNKGNYTLSITRNGCSSKPATTLVDIRDRIKVSAGADQTFCNNVGIINTNASEVGQSGILWTTSGTGTFSPNNHTLNALYLLSSSDRQQNAIKLTIKSTDSSACPSVSSFMNINLSAKPVVKAGVDVTVCSDVSSVPMNANTNANKFTWSSSGDGKFFPDSLSLNAQYTPGARDRAGSIINLKLSSVATSGCPAVQDEIKLTVNPSPVVKLGTNIEVLENEFSTLHPSIRGNVISYLWTPGQNMDNPNIKEPVIKGVNDIQYKLLVKDANGCIASDMIMINVLKPIKIPNTFTPNGDGINDRWYVDFLYQYKDARVQIFNRYGQLVFESKGYNNPWDGTFKGQPVPYGTYYYIIEIGHGKPGVKGYVTVIR